MKKCTIAKNDFGLIDARYFHTVKLHVFQRMAIFSYCLYSSLFKKPVHERKNRGGACQFY